jgi:drug/metabolite transporter (DMT)-like permease
MNKSKNISRAMLILAALIWGTSYVSQIVAMKYMGPFTFIFSRYVIGAAAVALLSLFLDCLKNRRRTGVDIASEWKKSIVGGAVCGTVMFCGMALQQYGLQYTQAGKAGFITAMYILIVPLLELLAGKRFGVRVWIATLIALVGLYLLSIKNGFQMAWGDLLVLTATIFWALYILCCDHFSQHRDPLKLSVIQFATTAALAVPCVLAFETPDLNSIAAAYVPILHAGVLCTAVAYTLEMAGQKNIPPVETSYDIMPIVTGCSAAWLAHLLWEQGVVGSNPTIPTRVLEINREPIFIASR